MPPSRWDRRASGPGSAVAPPGAAALYARLALRARAAFVRHVLPALAPGCVLDVGCGKGPWLRLLAAHGRAAIGVDRSWPMLRAARRAGRGAVALVQMEALHLAVADRAVANIIAVTLLQHLADAAPAIAELARVARARIAIYELTASGVPRWLAPHVVVRSVAWYRDAFCAHGWALRAVHAVGPPAAALWDGPRALPHLAARHAWLLFAPALVDAGRQAS